MLWIQNMEVPPWVGISMLIIVIIGFLIYFLYQRYENKN